MTLTPGLKFSSPPPADELTPRALERRLKRYFRKETHVFSVTCEPAFTSVLRREVETKLQPETLEEFTGGVEFRGSLETGMRANLLLRCAQRVQLRVGSFVCKSYPELFNKLVRVPWELYLGLDPVIDFKVSSRQSRLHQTDTIADTVFAGIEHYYSRFSGAVTRGKERIRVMIRFHQDQVLIGVDLSGEHLHRRGRKPFSVDAPMREDLAACLLTWRGLDKYPVIVDPCCGSGTLLLEAADILRELPPGRGREFAFRQLPWFQPGPRERLRAEWPGRNSAVRLIGGDLDPKSVAACRENSRLYDLDPALEVAGGDALEMTNRWGSSGLIVSNLPYGKRVGDRGGLAEFYRDFGTHLSRQFPGWDALLVSSRADLLKQIPLAGRKTLAFRNGGLKVQALAGRVVSTDNIR